MADPTIVDELIKLVPVVVGALLALAGGFGGQIMAHQLAKSRDRETMLREKGEMLVKALFAHIRWIEDKHDRLVFRGEDHDAPAPLDEARMLQRLYFPELATEVTLVMASYTPILGFCFREKIARMKDEQAWMKSYDNEEFGRLYKVSLDAVNAAADKIVKSLTKK